MMNSESLTRIATQRDMFDKRFFAISSMLQATDLAPYTPKAFMLLHKPAEIDKSFAAMDIDMISMLKMSKKPETVTMEEILPSEVCRRHIDEYDDYEQSLLPEAISDCEET
jgi:hypothetical protein